jgi:hypothetical protein
MRPLLTFVLVSVFAITGCHNEAAAPESQSPPVAVVTKEHLDDIPVRWSELASRWNGKIDERVPQIAKAALEQGTDLELLSLDYGKDEVGNNVDSYVPRKILGIARLTDTDARKMVLAAFDRALREFDVQEDDAAECFYPRHGLRMQHDGKTFRFDICFECLQLEFYIDGKRQQTIFHHSAQSLFNAVLSAANLSLPPD